MPPKKRPPLRGKSAPPRCDGSEDSDGSLASLHLRRRTVQEQEEQEQEEETEHVQAVRERPAAKIQVRRRIWNLGVVVYPHCKIQ